MDKEQKQKQKQLKVFGYGLPLILAFFSARHGFKHSWDALSFILMCLAVVLLAIVLWNKPLLERIFTYWMKGVMVIGMVVTAAILSVLYFFVFTPTACVLRLLGKDFMSRQWKPNVSSYWLPKASLGSQQDYTKQF